MNVSASDRASRRDWLMLGTLSVLMGIAGYLGSRDFVGPGVFWRAERGMLVESDQPELSAPGFTPPAGRDVALSDIGALEEIIWLRMELDLESAQIPDQPIALYLSGPFSAAVYWDGQRLGNKGQVGASAESEIPGPIDATFHIPDGWAGPGKHFLALRISAFHVGYAPSQSFHRLALGGFRADPRRELRYYAWPLLLSGGFLFIGLFFLRIYAETGALRALFSALMAGFILMQLAAEVSRSLVAYDYQWHLVRSVAIWLAALGWGLCWQWATWSRTRDRAHLLVMAVTLVAALVIAYLAEGFDLKVTRMISVLALMPLLVSLQRLAKSENDVILMADGVLAIALIATAQLVPESLLDRVLYFLLAIHLGMTWFWIFAGKQKVDAPIAVAHPEEFFSVKLAGRQMRVATADVIYLHAEGNFTELVCQDNKRYLHQHRLGEIMRSPPVGFVRIQRSYAVNTSYLESLQSFEGSRYEVRLRNGDTLPVSRYRVVDLREYLGGR